MMGEVVSLTRLTAGVFDLRIRAALQNPAPGRFVHAAVPGFSLRRPVSLCGFENGVARLVFAVKGRGTAALAEMKPGSPIDLLGALGNGFPEPNGKTLLVGGGIGLPPLVYYADTYKNTRLIAGFRSEDQVVFSDRIADLCLGNDYPHQRLKTLLEKGESAGQVLACGPEPLLKAVAAVCAEHGVPCFVSMEERMGCGVGACLVCACAVGGRYKRVCKDGPVFLSGDVFPAGEGNI